jgi:ankyrin repeat protein
VILRHIKATSDKGDTSPSFVPPFSLSLFLVVQSNQQQQSLHLLSRMDDPMFDACRDGRVDEVRRLLDAGEDVNGVYISGLTHVMMALDWGQLVVVRLLHARGADLSRVDRDGCNVLRGG